MSFREKLKKVVEIIREPAKESVALPPKRAFRDGICDVCQKALAAHGNGKSGLPEDCHGTPMEFIDELRR